MFHSPINISHYDQMKRFPKENFSLCNVKKINFQKESNKSYDYNETKKQYDEGVIKQKELSSKIEIILNSLNKLKKRQKIMINGITNDYVNHLREISTKISPLLMKPIFLFLSIDYTKVEYLHSVITNDSELRKVLRVSIDYQKHNSLKENEIKEIKEIITQQKNLSYPLSIIYEIIEKAFEIVNLEKEKEKLIREIEKNQSVQEVNFLLLQHLEQKDFMMGSCKSNLSNIIIVSTNGDVQKDIPKVKKKDNNNKLKSILTTKKNFKSIEVKRRSYHGMKSLSFTCKKEQSSNKKNNAMNNINLIPSKEKQSNKVRKNSFNSCKSNSCKVKNIINNSNKGSFLPSPKIHIRNKMNPNNINNIKQHSNISLSKSYSVNTVTNITNAYSNANTATITNTNSSFTNNTYLNVNNKIKKPFRSNLNKLIIKQKDKTLKNNNSNSKKGSKYNIIKQIGKNGHSNSKSVPKATNKNKGIVILSLLNKSPDCSQKTTAKNSLNTTINKSKIHNNMQSKDISLNFIQTDTNENDKIENFDSVEELNISYFKIPNIKFTKKYMSHSMKIKKKIETADTSKNLEVDKPIKDSECCVSCT